MSHTEMKDLFEAANALRAFIDEMPDEVPTDSRLAVEHMNGALELYEELFSKLALLGLNDVAAEWKQRLTGSLMASMTRAPEQISIGEERALVASVLRRKLYRLPIAGERDSPMVAAMDAAELFVLAAMDAGKDASDDAWIEAFQKRYEAKLSDNRDLYADYEKVRKSIQRFKKQVAARPFFRFDEGKMRFEEVREEKALHGLTDQKGRPKRDRF